MLPAPLVPFEIDLRGFEWMPYYGQHLLSSEFLTKASDAVFRAAHLLWWAAWNQQPAASLPDDDKALAFHAGFGRDLKGWKKIRPDALHGFVKCDDGRLYHRFQAKLALEAWAERQDAAVQRKIWKLRKRNHRAALLLEEQGKGQQTRPLSRGQSTSCPGDVPDSCPRDSPPPVSHMTGQDRTGEKKEEGSVEAGASTAAMPPSALDLKREMWQAGKRLLGAHGIDSRRAGQLIGRWRKQLRENDYLLIDAFAAAEAEAVQGDIVAYLEGCIARKTNGQATQRTPLTSLFTGTALALADREKREADRAVGDNAPVPLLDQ